MRYINAILILLFSLTARAEIIKSVDNFSGAVTWESSFLYSEDIVINGKYVTYYYPSVSPFNIIAFSLDYPNNGTPRYTLHVYLAKSKIFGYSLGYISADTIGTFKVNGQFVDLGKKLNGSDLEYAVFDGTQVASQLRKNTDQAIPLRVSGSGGTFDVTIQPYILKEWALLLDTQASATLESKSAPIGMVQFGFNEDNIGGYVYHPTSPDKYVDYHIYVNGKFAKSDTAKDLGSGANVSSVSTSYMPKFTFTTNISNYLLEKGRLNIDVYGIGLSGVNSLLGSFNLQSITDIDCVFNQAESYFPDLLPGHQSTSRETTYFVRHYSNKSMLAINRLTGSVSYRLGNGELQDGGIIDKYKAMWGECSSTSNSSVNVTVKPQVVVTPAPTISSFTATPNPVDNNGSTTLQWSSSNATGCTSNIWNGNLKSSGSLIVSGLTSDQTYNLTCTGSGGTASSSVTVTVAPTINSFTATPNPVEYNGSTTLQWSATLGTKCTSNAWSGSLGSLGNKIVSGLTGSQTYNLTCTGPGGTANTSLTVTVKPQVVLAPGAYKIGSKGPSGGIVFSVDSTGLHGLEAQAQDANVGGTADSCCLPAHLYTWDQAITAAQGYGTGWHLPTKDELNLLYEQKIVVGGFMPISSLGFSFLRGNIYWSSTESDASRAWYQYVGNGYQNAVYKHNNQYQVRAVRAF